MKFFVRSFIRSFVLVYVYKVYQGIAILRYYGIRILGYGYKELYTHTHTYIYIYVYVYGDMRKRYSTLLYLILSFLFFYFSGYFGSTPLGLNERTNE